MAKKMDAKKLKLIVKGEKKPTFGTDPNEPWSVRAGITESDKGMLHDYLKSRGINPDFVSKDTKISHAKSHEFHKWKRDHMFDDPINYVSTTAADKMKKIRAQTEEVEIEEMKTLKLTPVEMRQKALTRAKRLTTVIKHNGLHKEEALDKKTPTVEELAKKYNVSKEEIEKELEKGIKVEMEHSSDKKVAREIALDHLGEKMDYYKKLIKFVEEKEQLDELSPGTLSSYVLKTTSKDPKRAEPRKKAMSKLAKIMAKRPVDPKAPRYSTKLFGEGYDDHEEIAKELIRRHGMNITKDHLKALENERDSRGALDHDAVMNKVRAMGAMTEAKTIQGTALDKFRQASAERARKHADIEKEMKARHAAGKEDMKGAIDRLEKHLNKEEVEQIDELNYDTVKSLYNKRRDDFHGDQVGKKKKGKEVSAKNVSRSISRLMGFKPTRNQPQKEEFEQIDEISKSTLASYKDKSSASMKNAQVNRDAAEAGKNMSKGFSDLHTKSNAIVKKRVKGLIGYMQRKQGMKPTSEETVVEGEITKTKTGLIHRGTYGTEYTGRGVEDSTQKDSKDLTHLNKQRTKNLEKGMDVHFSRVKEDVFQDTQAATQTAFDMGTQADDREPVYSKRKEMSKSARMIKALYKKHKMVKEEIYDHEKEDKSVATYGKKPKVDKLEVYDDEAQAAMVLKGGKTLTGQTRDTLEIDPIMRKANNNNNN